MRLRSPRRRPAHSQARVATAFRRDDAGPDYYDGVLVGAETIGRLATSAEAHAAVQDVIGRGRDDDDDYLAYVRDFTRDVRDRAQGVAAWADITTALWAATRLIEPRDYLEIGVRRGRSVSIVGAGAPDSSITGIDLWVEGYAGMENPGPDHVRGVLGAVGHRGPVELLSGDSHDLLPAPAGRRGLRSDHGGRRPYAARSGKGYQRRTAPAQDRRGARVRRYAPPRPSEAIACLGAHGGS